LHLLPQKAVDDSRNGKCEERVPDIGIGSTPWPRQTKCRCFEAHCPPTTRGTLRVSGLARPWRTSVLCRRRFETSRARSTAPSPSLSLSHTTRNHLTLSHLVPYNSTTSASNTRRSRTCEHSRATRTDAASARPPNGPAPASLDQPPCSLCVQAPIHSQPITPTRDRRINTLLHHRTRKQPRTPGPSVAIRA
jgi:hypothetical protein